MLNFETWNNLLDKYVDSQGRVNYQKWKVESTEELTDWLDRASQIDLQQYPDPNQQLALWINLYNALTIAQILKQYPIKSILPKVLGIPNWIAFFWFFSCPVYTLREKRYSLNDIEHKILRPKFNDPRIHFALVCASIGCPLLRNEAYFPKDVQTQLEEDARRFINNPDKVSYDSQSQTLYCSKIFKWYGQDFLKVTDSIPQYIQNYLSGNVELNASTPIRYLDYDWSLNQRTSS
jgi:Protein of unknown function, DUF547